MLKTEKTWQFFPPDSRFTFEDALSSMTLTKTFARKWALYLLTCNTSYDKMSYKSDNGRKVYTVTREDLE